MRDAEIREYEDQAKLALSETEKAYISELADMLTESFGELEKIDTETVLPLVTVLDVNNVFRKDRANKTVSREELLISAPEVYDGYFSVPKTLI
ncbi:MAG: Asp-tRNA(Asn)/Glu-tRNA(Gln) amidotransferase subunit GatC [Oscillospiraceae bacterium]|nr:Asp-tRNA(Asn)/Glu-tRNA(Gln) amidotransferase subunit GatC [Oscillospiraceae bacterium]